MPETSRRAFIARTGAGALAAALPFAAGAEQAAAAELPDAPAVTPVKNVDVAIIGAGLTGLSAARALRAAGLTVHVVEADDRVGGRVWTQNAADGTPINWGATFIGPRHTRMIALAKEFGMRLYRVPDGGKKVSYFGGKRATYTGSIPPLDLETLLESQAAITRINQMARGIDVAAPWKSPHAHEFDGQTVESWKRANIFGKGARELIDLGIQAIFSVEPSEISMLYLLTYVKANHSFDYLINTTGGAQQWLLEGGTQQVPIRLAADLGAGSVTLDSPARKIVSGGGGVTVTSDKVVVQAKQVIVATPPTLTDHIEFDPPLPATKAQLLQRLPFGSIGKVYAIYDEPFWAKSGLNGQVTSDIGPMKALFDVSPPGGKPGILMGFIDGQDARDFSELSAADRKSSALAQLKTYFGAQAGSPREYHDLLWDELPLHRGCPVSIFPPGVLTGFGPAFASSVGPLHFASTETALQSAGYMDGAVRAGEAAAAEVRAAL